MKKKASMWDDARKSAPSLEKLCGVSEEVGRYLRAELLARRRAESATPPRPYPVIVPHEAVWFWERLQHEETRAAAVSLHKHYEPKVKALEGQAGGRKKGTAIMKKKSARKASKIQTEYLELRKKHGAKAKKGWLQRLIADDHPRARGYKMRTIKEHTKSLL